MSKLDTIIRPRIAHPCWPNDGKCSDSGEMTIRRRPIYLTQSPLWIAVFMAVQCWPDQARAESGYVNVCRNSGLNHASNSYSSLKYDYSSDGCGYDSSLGGLSATIVIGNMKSSSTDGIGSLTLFSEGTLRYSGPQAIFKSNLNLDNNKLTKLGSGTNDSDASNMGQLKDLASTLGGGTSFQSDGSLSGPSYRVQGKGSNSVGDAIGDLDSAISNTKYSVSNVDARVTNLSSNIQNGTIGLLRQSGSGSDITVAKDTGGDKINFAGTFKEAAIPGARQTRDVVKDRLLTGVKAGIANNDAANMSQLKSVATALGGGAAFTSDGSLTAPSYRIQTQNYSNVGDALGAIDSSVTNLSSNIQSGSIGLVRQNGSGSDITVAKDTDGDKVNFAGTFKEPLSPGATQTRDIVKDRLLTGIKAGIANNDAANMSQLKSVATALGGGAAFTSDGSFTAPSYQIQTRNYSNVGDALGAIDSSFSSLSNHIQSGTIGLVQQAAAGSDITVAKDTDGDKVDFSGSFVEPGDNDLARKVTAKKDRVLTGIASGRSDNDAVNVAQLKKTGLLDDNGDSLNAVIYASNKKDRVSFGGGPGGTVLANVAPGLVARDSMQAVNGGQLYALREDISRNLGGLDRRLNHLETKVIGDDEGNIDVGTNATEVPAGRAYPSKATDTNADNVLSPAADSPVRSNNIGVGNGNATQGSHALGIGNGNTVTGSDSMAQGVNNTVTGNSGIAVGYGNTAGEYAQAIGSNNVVGNRGLAHGNDNTVTGGNSIALGYRNSVAGGNSVAAGSGNKVSGQNSIGLGQDTQVSGNRSAAIGAGATATASNAVALGSNAVADRADTVAVGSDTYQRQITQVAPGTQRTDAANWGQVQDSFTNLQNWTNHQFYQLGRQLDRVGAMGSANTQMSINAAGVQPGRGRVAVGLGFQGGQSAMAVGYAKAISERARFSVGVAFSSSVQSMGAGFGFDM